MGITPQLLQTIGDHELTLLALLTLVATGYLCWLLSGIINVKRTNGRTWSWRRFFTDLAKVITQCIAMAVWVANADITGWLVGCLNITELDTVMSVISVGSVVVLPFALNLYYLKLAATNFRNFWKSKEVAEELGGNITIGDNADYAAVANAVKEVADKLTPRWTRDSAPTDAGAELEALAEEQVGQGAYVSPLSRRLPDGDTDGGKKWQCSKYAYYLGTGIRMNYAPHPDYGPCNGRDMVDYLCRNCGFVRCGKETGAIFSYDTGTYGHCGMVVDADKNMVNDANWQPLTVATHYLNLDAVGAWYCKPAAEAVPEPTPEPKPTEEAKVEPEPEPEPAPAPEPPKKSNDEIAQEVIKGLWGNGADRVKKLQNAGYDYNAIQELVNKQLGAGTPLEASADKITYTYKAGDTFGQVILNLGLNTGRGLWGDDGDVAYYTRQLNEQGISGNIPIGTTFTLTRRAA